MRKKNEHEDIIYNISDIFSICNFIHEKIRNRVVCFSGEMGAGKTTLIKSLCKKIGGVELANSPSFGLINVYESRNGSLIYHLDCYRLRNSIEALDLGVEEYLNSGNWVFIEWPERIEELLPPLRTEIQLLVIDENTRRLKLRNLSKVE